MHVPIVGTESKVRFWPGEMNTYGKNPYGKPLYRIVWSESRTYLLGGQWPDGRIEYRWVPLYGNKKAWMLEKWLAPEEFAGSEEAWKQETINYPLTAHGIVVYTMGPYPKKGIYEHCYTFPEDCEPNLEMFVQLLESSKHIGIARIKAGIKAYHDAKRKEWESKVEDGFAEAQGAFHNQPTNIFPGKVTPDRVNLAKPEELTAEIRRKRGLAPKLPNKPPKDLELPGHGFSIR